MISPINHPLGRGRLLPRNVLKALNKGQKLGEM